jgi:hypothetical protein
MGFANPLEYARIPWLSLFPKPHYDLMWIGADVIDSEARNLVGSLGLS